MHVVTYKFENMKSLFLHIGLAMLVFTSSSNVSPQVSEPKKEKIKLLYVYDPLCGWCYGFGPVVEKIERNYQSDIEVEIISGGMIMGERIAPVGNMADYILQAIPRLERMTGAAFGEPYKQLLKEGTYVTSSEKPSVALCVYKSFKKDSAVSYGHTIQTSFYKYAKDLNNDTLYADIAKDFGIDRTQFLNRMRDSTYLNQAHAEFKKAAALGVTGFPTLLMKQENGYVKISEGYATYDSIEKYIQKEIKSAAEKK
jgi:putative protein-disulfide isomerase